MLESVRNSTICNVSSRMYYQYFTFNGLDYTRNIVFSLIFLQIFIQRNIFRKLRITVISSSQWSVVSTLWVVWGNVHCRLMKPHVSVSFVVSLTINKDITFHKKETVHIWFIEPWRINGTSFPTIWWNSFTLCIFRSK